MSYFIIYCIGVLFFTVLHATIPGGGRVSSESIVTGILWPIVLGVGCAVTAVVFSVYAVVTAMYMLCAAFVFLMGCVIAVYILLKNAIMFVINKVR